ncbi:MAG: response regulator [Bryobacteraceae bacterium]|nr:response regulator [Bryobacteraceae bacterium]
MRKILTSSAWNWITLGVALVGILSVGNLIGQVTALQAQFDRDANWISGLKSLERSIWDLQMAALRPKEERVAWIQAESAYRNQIEILSRRAQESMELAGLLTNVSGQVNSIWSIHMEMAGTETARVAAAQQLQTVGGSARGQIHAAVDQIWGRQSEAAHQVAEKWLSVKNQLILCCLFAGFPALLLRIHHLRVAEKKRVEGALEESEDRYRKLVDLLPDAVLVHRGGKIIFGNQAFARLMREESLDRLVGKSILDLMHPDDHWVAWRNWEQFRETQQHTPLMEQRMMREDGQTFDIDFMATSFRLDDQPAVLVVIRDISERKRSADAVRKTEARFRTLFESVLEGVYRASPDGQLLEANPSLVKMLGYNSLQELRLAGADPIADPAQRQAWLAGLHREGEVTNQEVSLRRRDGGLLVVLNHARAVKDEQGSLLYIEGTVTDVTAMKVTEERLREYTRELEETRGRLEEQAKQLERTRDEALEASRLKSEFLANVSHEIRTPMNAVIGMTQLLLDSRLSAEQRDNAETVRGQADFLLGLINDILDFSKIEAGRLSFEQIPFSLQSCVSTVMDMFAERAEGKGLDFAFLEEGPVPDSLKGDPIRVQQVLTNLVGNAIKFTEQGQIVITCRTVERRADSVLLRFDVEDSGIGIEVMNRQRLFEPFTQGDGSTTRRYGGTGLGLAISKQLAEAMGGEVGLESTVDVGSTFWFTVRLTCLESAPVEEPRLSAAPVLVAVSRDSSRRLHRKQAQGWGWETAEAANGAELMTHLRTVAYGVVLIDAELPDCDLLAVVAYADSLPAARRPKLVLQAPFSRRTMSEVGLETRPGFAAILPRPLRQSEWRQLLERLANELPPLETLPEHVPVQLADLGQALEQAAAPAPVALPPGAPAPEAPLVPGVRILITEDNVVNQKVAMKLIRKLGFEADLASNGREAVDLLAKRHYDLVFMDCQMPVLDGYGATTEIRRAESGGQHTPIVAMTAHAMQGDREKCLAAGMDDYLTKPIQLSELRRAIAQYVPLESDVLAQAG